MVTLNVLIYLTEAELIARFVLAVVLAMLLYGVIGQMDHPILEILHSKLL